MYDIIGKVFGRLTVIGPGETRNGRKKYLCRCACGTEKIIRASNITTGRTKSCGCLQREIASSNKPPRVVNRPGICKICKRKSVIAAHSMCYHCYHLLRKGHSVSEVEEKVSDPNWVFGRWGEISKAARLKRQTEKFHRLYEPVPECGCWIWLGPESPKGYGCYKWDTRHIAAHRFSWQIHFGEIQDDLFVLHRCDNPRCVNPGHLFLGTNQDNMDDMKTKERQARGEKSPRAKITERDVFEIRSAYPFLSQNTLACLYGIHESQISRIIRGENWKHSFRNTVVAGV